MEHQYNNVPGPWKVVQDFMHGEAINYIVTENDAWIAKVNPAFRNSDDNAHLLAAAPALMQGLEEAVEMCDEAMGEWSAVPRVYLPSSMVPLYDIRENAMAAIALEDAQKDLAEGG